MKITKLPKRKIWTVEKLKNEETRQEFQNRVYNGVIALGTELSWEEIPNNIG